MSTIVRRSAVAVVWALAFTAIYRWCVPQLRCNLVEHTSVNMVEPLLNTTATESPERVPIARREMRLISECLERCGPAVPRLHLLAKYNRFLQNYDESVALYRRALELDQRPELYYELGLVLAEAKRRDEAIENLLIAAKHEPRYIEFLTYYNAEVKQLRDAYFARLRGTAQP